MPFLYEFHHFIGKNGISGEKDEGNTSQQSDFRLNNLCEGILLVKYNWNLMEKVINTYEVGFLINISELGEDDPLSQNATQYFGSSKAPWYTTIARKGEESDYFIKEVNISSGRTLDIIALNTEKIQDAYISGQPCANEALIGGPHLTPITQVSYPPKSKSVPWQQNKLREFCKSKGVHLTGYSPLGSPGIEWLKSNVFKHPILTSVAKKLGKSPAKVALCWGLQMGHSVLPKSKNEMHIKENFDVFNWSIPDDLLAEFSKIEQARLVRGDFLVSDTYGDYKTVEELWDGEI